MDTELKQLITGFVLFAIVVGVVMFLTGDKNKANLGNFDRDTSNVQEGGVGHPLWQD